MCCCRHPHVWILTDDMYEHLIYGGFEFHTIAAGRAGALRPHADHERRLESLCHDRLAHRLCRRPGAADQGDGKMQSQSTSNPPVHRAMGGGRGAERAAGLHRRNNAKCSRSAATSSCRCSTRRMVLKCPTPQVCFQRHLLCRHHGQADRHTLATDQDFVTELLEAEGVAVVQAATWSWARIPGSYATKTEDLEGAARFFRGI